MRLSHSKRQIAARRNCQPDVDPPQCPRQPPPVALPLRHAHEADHIHDSRESHGKASQEQALARVADHCRPNVGPERVTEKGYQGEKNEEENVEGEDGVADTLQPVGIVGEIVQEDRRYTRSHCDGKPRGRKVANDLSPAALILRFAHWTGGFHGRSDCRRWSAGLYYACVGGHGAIANYIGVGCVLVRTSMRE